jgi:Tfp pilus assembly protein PilZ
MNGTKFNPERQSPRAEAALEVEVEVAGEKRKVLLTTKDIGAGGMFLRTENPAPLWKKVKLAFDLADGSRFEISGEVVRSLTPEKAREKGGQPGMAVAFDEISRSRRKQLLELVLELCSRRPTERAKEPPPPATPAATGVKAPVTQPRAVESRPKADDDDLLRQLDSLIESVEEKKNVASSSSGTDISLELDIPEEVEAAPPREKITTLEGNLRRYLGQVKGSNHYQVLLLDQDAGPEQIQKAYRALLDSLSPDIPAESLPEQLRRELSEALIRIRKAYAILSQPDRKRAYDFLIDNTRARN